MKRKLHLLILAILVMTMSLGMSLVVFAGLPDGTPGLGDIPEEYKSLSNSIFYVTSTNTYTHTTSSGEVPAVEGRSFRIEGSTGNWFSQDCYDGSFDWFRASNFKTLSETGWYYLWKNSFFIPVNEQPGVIDHVNVDFNNANVGGKKWSEPIKLML